MISSIGIIAGIALFFYVLLPLCLCFIEYKKTRNFISMLSKAEEKEFIQATFIRMKKKEVFFHIREFARADKDILAVPYRLCRFFEQGKAGFSTLSRHALFGITENANCILFKGKNRFFLFLLQETRREQNDLKAEILNGLEALFSVKRLLRFKPFSVMTGVCIFYLYFVYFLFLGGKEILVFLTLIGIFAKLIVYIPPVSVGSFFLEKKIEKKASVSHPVAFYLIQSGLKIFAFLINGGLIALIVYVFFLP
ncbi:hypothetical protein DWQ65_02555 [Treponema phagedenis]|uniref:Uncharacterized protein n=2 Tax=Treponema phagedenis TaxID=162 RepID=A0A0B7GUI9_TREPH|nr:hypothetical protein [Treponema phagedenis]NVP23752.1 hypothetical protein [Treponema phagedenis]QEJ94428.1 hypothetical protein FUT79_03875 [Treponema phagedenis]QEJ97492.1 hypothetical protein FUT82_05410 [Treponema phagedenis]QEK01691.1 hypothetical protein FUT84_11340 [Treponema phagedenis]QEK03062.1 hypothetical protein FUT83_04020 [Treponema phagedenis]